MQIRLTVVDPLGPAAQRGRTVSRDVLVTAPAGTDLAAVASALASAVTGDGGPGGRETSGAPVVLYAGAERLDARRRILGEPPLVDGAVLSLGAPAAPEPHPELDDAPAQLHVIAGPDAGGVHLLHGGQITIGRSADADVPLDDPDVSRLHCAVTVAADGRVSVADLHSTNGTDLDGTRVTDRPVRLAPGALLRIGESALRLTPSGGPGARVGTAPDGDGCVRVLLGGEGAEGGDPADGSGGLDAGGFASPARVTAADRSTGPAGPTHHAYGTAGWGASGGAAGGQEHGPAESPVVPAQGEAPRIESRGGAPTAGQGGGSPQAGWGSGAPAGAGQGSGLPAGAGHGEAPQTAGRGDGSPAAGPRHEPPSSAGRGDGPRPAGSGHEPSPSGRRDGAPATAPGHEPPFSAGRGYEPSPSGRGYDPSSAGSRGGLPGPRAGSATTQRTGDPQRPAAADRATTDRATATGRSAPTQRSGDTHAGRSGVLGGPGPRSGSNGSASGSGARSGPTGPASGPGSRSGAIGPATSDPAAHHRTSPDSVPSADDVSDGPAPSAKRKGTPLRGTDAPALPGARRRGGLGAWARRLAGGRGEVLSAADGEPAAEDGGTASAGAPAQPETWPDPAALLLTALGPGPRLWERGPGHPETLTVRLGTADRPAPDGPGLLPAVPVTADLREAGALGLAGPRTRLAGLARAVLAQLATLHSPDLLEIVLISADRARSLEERTAEWSWLGWLPHVRPGHGQDCRLLLAYDREQAAARVEELLRRVEDLSAPRRPATAADRPNLAGTTTDAPPAEAAHRPSWARDDLGADDGDGDGRGGFPGPYTVVVVDGDPGGSALRDAVARLTVAGPRAGVHVICLAETAPTSPTSPVTQTYEAACAVTPTFRECGAVALLSGDVATALHLLRVARTDAAGPLGPGTLAAVDAVSPAWAERFARALAPLRPDGPAGDRHTRVTTPLPQSARLLDELGLARATPASLMARWADAADDTESLGGRARAVLGAGPRGPLGADLVTEGPHLLVEGPPGSGRTELLRAMVASLAASDRPDRLGIVLIDGRDGVGTGAGAGLGEGLRVCTDIPHVTTHLSVNDPVRMRELAQSLSAELKRRAELLGRSDFTDWHAQREISGRIVAQRGRPAASGAADIEAPPSSTIRLRPSAGAAARQRTEAPPPLPRLVVVVDDLDALVSPALGSPGRPAAGSVMRALEAVAKEGDRLGVHLIAATGAGGRTAETEPARRATLRVTLDPPAAGPDEPAPGRGRLTTPDGHITAFQAGRVTGRIPRTATQRPTVVPLDWPRMGDPPTRRPVRELGNGPTDLALLASAVERAAREVSAAEVPSLL
ncbi:FHA domain-containing protein [Streptomyces sp. NPDC002677]|uniref:FHA domain-containing protein n=1 Tax=Streptomyces sp. NPDC002677 TaxID=3154774 RepID=UPI0033282EC9